MPRIPHDPDLSRQITACMRVLRKRHTRNPRRMYARRMETVHFGLEVPVIPNPHWFEAVARRYVRMGGKETR